MGIKNRVDKLCSELLYNDDGEIESETIFYKCIVLSDLNTITELILIGLCPAHFCLWTMNTLINNYSHGFTYEGRPIQFEGMPTEFIPQWTKGDILQ